MDRGFDALAINISSEKAQGLANAIHRELRKALLSGRFAAGSRMPATRILAKELGVSRNTIVEVYERLVAEFFLIAKHGAGTYVNTQLPAAFLEHKEGGAEETSKDPLSNSVASINWLRPSAKGLLEFRPGLPDLRSFPIDQWRRTAMRGLKPAMTRQSGYSDPQGDGFLREQISKYIRTSRAVRCTIDSVVVTSGAQQAFDILSRSLMLRNATVAVEEPGYLPAIATFENAGARVISIPVDQEGLIVSQIPTGTSVVYTTPSHQFPLGMTMSLPRRVELLDWAARNNAWIIEDDYDSEFRYGGRRVEALHAMDANDRVIYVGSFSKVLLPAFRLGYAILPPKLRDEFLRIKWISDRHTAAPMQAVLAEYIDTGGFGLHLRKMQSIYLARFELLASSLRRLPADIAYLIPSEAGLHLTLLLPETTSMSNLLETARIHGLGLYPLSTFCRQPFAPGLVLGFGNVELGEIQTGLDVLCPILHDMGAKSKAAAR